MRKLFLLLKIIFSLVTKLQLGNATFLVVLIFTFLTTNVSFPQMQIEWAKSYPIKGKSMALDSLGNVIIVGQKDSLVYTLKYNSTGQLIWHKDTVVYPNGQSFKSAVDKYGNIYVTLEDGNSLLNILKYDSSGNHKWSVTPFVEFDRCFGIALDTLGNIFLTCESFYGARMGFLTLKYNTLGQLVWYKRYTLNTGSRSPHSIFVDLKGNAYVTGTNTDGTILDYLTIKYDSSGNQKWISSYNGRANWGDEGNSVFADNNGFCYVTGYTHITDPKISCGTIKYNNNGDSIWTRVYPVDTTGSNYNQFGNFVFADPSGNVYVSGDEMGEGWIDSKAITAMKYDNTGNLKWSRMDSDVVKNPSSVLDKDGNFYLLGDGTNYIKGVGYDKNGNKIWEYVYPYYFYGGTNILCNKNKEIYLLISSSDTLRLFKFSAVTGINNANNNSFINDFNLYQNYPNPFNPVTKIKFEVPRGSPTGAFGDDNGGGVENDRVVLKVYDILGKEIETLVNEKLNPGTYEVTFNASQYPSGVYFYSLYIDGKIIDAKRMIVLK
jgi:hypothetical protein